jgi:hypothetical protein
MAVGIADSTFGETAEAPEREFDENRHVLSPLGIDPGS